MTDTDAIAIRPFDEADVSHLFDAARESTAQVFPWLRWCRPDYSLEDARAWVAHAQASSRDGSEHDFAIVSGAGRLLGGCGLNAIRRELGIANLGYWVRTSVRGKGAAPAAVRLLVGWARNHTTLRRIEALVPVGNAASQRVAEKAGGAREGILQGRMLLHGVRHDAVVYSFTLERSE